MYWPAGPGGIGMCRKLRNPLSPKNTNIRPSRMRATRTAIFMAFSLVEIDMVRVRLSAGSCPKLNSDASTCSRWGWRNWPRSTFPDLSCAVPPAVTNVTIRNADKSEDGAKVRIDEVERGHGSSCFVDSAGRDQNGGFFAREQALRSVRPIGKGASAADDLVDPQLEHRGNAEVVHGHAEHVLVCLLEFGDALL